MKPSQKDINEIHALITDWASRKGFETPTILALFSSMIVGTMAMKGYDQDFADATFDLMKKRFKNHPARKPIS